jgi:hypothetical protein
MNRLPGALGFCLFSTAVVSVSYAAEVRVCNRSDAVLNNLDVNSWKLRKLDVGECTDYFKNPMAQEYVPVSITINGNHLSFMPKKTSYLLGEGKFSYQVTVTSDRVQLVTVKD